MNLYQQLAFGEAKKQFAHYIVDCITVRNSYVNIQLHNYVEYRSAIETSCTIANAVKFL